MKSLTNASNPLWERANNWAIGKLIDAGYSDSDSPDAQLAQGHLLQAALACPTLMDTDDDGSSELA